MSWISRLKNAFNSRNLDDEIAEELQGHIEALVEALRADGLSEAEALRQARLRFGNVTGLQERTRDFKIAGFADSVVQDVRYTLRGVHKAPGFYTTAILSLGLAIGAVTAIYSILAAAVLRPLPVRDPGQLVTFNTRTPGEATESREGGSFSYPLFKDLQSAGALRAGLQMFSYAGNVEMEDRTGRSRSLAMRQYVSGGAFGMLGVKPALGRLLGPNDDVLPNGSDVAVISYDFWNRRFARDPRVLGQKLRLNRGAYQIVGVARAGFFGVQPGKFVDIWLPAAASETKQAFNSRNTYWFFIVGRLRKGSTQQLAARLQPAFIRGQLDKLRGAPPNLPEHFKEQLRSERLIVLPGEFGVSLFRKDFRQPVWIVFIVSVSLVLIACANIASLLLAKGTARSAEMAMRISLGASQARLLRQALTESLVLSLMGGAAGWLLARMLAPVLVSLLSTQTDPVRFALFLDTRALTFSTIASCMAALLFGSLPAVQSSRVSPIAALRSFSGQAGKLRLGRWMVSGQVAGAFCLVAVGAAFSFTLWHLLSRDKGFDERNVTVFNIGSDRSDGSAPDRTGQCRQLLGRLRNTPGIVSAGAARWPIYVGSSSQSPVIIPGKPWPDHTELYYEATPGYFTTLRTRLLSGRDLTEHDTRAKQPIASVVNAALAQKYFKTANAVGRHFERPDNKGKPIAYEIVGVVENAFYRGNRKGAEPIVYQPLAGEPVTSYTVYVRSSLSLSQVTRIVQGNAEAVGTHVYDTTQLETLVGNSVLREKLLAGLGATFGFMSLLLAGIGVFGLLNYSVVRRMRELGIRAALGATRFNLVALVARDLAAMMTAGVVVGLLAALSLMPLLRSLFFGIETFDPSVMVTAACCFLVAAFVAGGLPARRAASIDPNVALREE